MLAGEPDAIGHRLSWRLSRPRPAGPRRSVGAAHAALAAPVCHHCSANVFAQVAAENAAEPVGDEIDACRLARRRQLPGEIAADETDHQVEVEGKAEEIDVVLRRPLD